MRLEPEFIRNLIHERSASMASISALLAARECSGIRALFAFVTICREAIDGAGSRTEAQASISLLTRLFESGVVQRYAKEYSVVDEVIDAVPDFGLAWEAWSFLEEDFEIPRAYAIDFIRGLKQDVDGYRPDTVEDLLRYVYRTGGVLGLMACHIFSAQESIQQSAVDAASAARLTTLAGAIYRDFTLGRCFVPTAWLSYAVTQTFAPTWSSEAARRFRQLAVVLDASSRPGLRTLAIRNRSAIAVAAVLHRESRASLPRKLDRAADELIRHAADAFWTSLAPKLRRAQNRSRQIGFAIADVFEKRSFSAFIETAAREQFEHSVEAPRTPLPVRDLATTLRNQNILMGRNI